MHGLIFFAGIPVRSPRASLFQRDAARPYLADEGACRRRRRDVDLMPDTAGREHQPVQDVPDRRRARDPIVQILQRGARSRHGRSRHHAARQ